MSRKTLPECLTPKQRSTGIPQAGLGNAAHLFALRSSVFSACSLEMLSGRQEMELLLHTSSTREVHPPMPSGSPSRQL